MPPLTSRDTVAPRTRVFLACSGLGTIHRGYESFIRASYDALRRQPGLEVRLFKGSGAPTAGEQPLRHLPRDGAIARTIGAVVRRGPYVVEQVSFAASLIPHVVRDEPDVIFFCDPAIGKVLGRWRQLNAATYRLVFHNSGPIAPPFPWFDHVQQVTPAAHDEAMAAGEPANRHTFLPCALDIGTAPVRATPAERAARRRALGFPETRPVILSVGALNRHHKRMDYLVREVASLPEPRPHLVMLGQEEADTPAVRAMANLLLGSHGFSIRTVAQHEVDDYYRAADVFTLASLREGFGLGYAEALAHGLPCVAHDFSVARFVLGDEGIFADLREPGALAEALSRALASDSTEAVIQRRHAGVAQRFGWSALAPHYARMLRESTHQSQRRMAART